MFWESATALRIIFQIDIDKSPLIVFLDFLWVLPCTTTVSQPDLRYRTPYCIIPYRTVSYSIRDIFTAPTLFEKRPNWKKRPTLSRKQAEPAVLSLEASCCGIQYANTCQIYLEITHCKSAAMAESSVRYIWQRVDLTQLDGAMVAIFLMHFWRNLLHHGIYGLFSSASGFFSFHHVLCLFGWCRSPIIL